VAVRVVKLVVSARVRVEEKWKKRRKEKERRENSFTLSFPALFFYSLEIKMKMGHAPVGRRELSLRVRWCTILPPGSVARDYGRVPGYNPPMSCFLCSDCSDWLVKLRSISMSQAIAPVIPYGTI
jgi:hypothetical protein